MLNVMYLVSRLEFELTDKEMKLSNDLGTRLFRAWIRLNHHSCSLQLLRARLGHHNSYIPREFFHSRNLARERVRVARTFDGSQRGGECCLDGWDKIAEGDFSLPWSDIYRPFPFLHRVFCQVLQKREQTLARDEKF